jgi:hypothetical protein
LVIACYFGNGLAQHGAFHIWVQSGQCSSWAAGKLLTQLGQGAF